VPAARAERAPAKVNLTLRVVGRRPDGYHDIESLVVFADVGDDLTLAPARSLSLVVRGPTAPAAGSLDDNLVLKAARHLAGRCAELKVGRFVLSKRLPVAAGIGGGSSDAAAALRLLARRNRIAPDDPRLMRAARATGADVPVCLDPRARVMTGIGEILSAPLALPRLPAVLVNPGVAVPTRQVFAALRLHAGRDANASATSPPSWAVRDRDALIRLLAGDRNDLEPPAISLAPAIATALGALRKTAGCRLARMSGAGATCFALFDTMAAAKAAARALRAGHPRWWVRATALG
jgi:4-diphosphocytidyl-2-C-methyl-D-erythritol kinase